MSDDRELKKVIALTYAYYRHDTIPPAVLRMYAIDLAEYPIQKVIRAYDAWRKNPGNRKFPLPADIIGVLNPEVSDEDSARDSASRVIAATLKYGSYNEDKAKAFVGELGWTGMLRMYGTWKGACEQITPKNTPIVQAQLRDLCRAIVSRRRAGMKDESGTSLPEPDGERKSTGMVSTGDLMNSMKYLDARKV